jgi:hypothetical protein
MHLRLIPAVAVAAATLLAAADARAQEACVTDTQSDFINYQYSPTRPFSLRNGRLSVLANDIVADDEHDFDTATRSVIAPATAGALKAVATYDVLSGVADVETYLFGYGEAGIEVTMEARSSSGALLCSASEELYIARYYETGSPSFGVRTLECALASSTTSATISLTAHAWVTVGGASGGEAHTSVQIVNFGIESCTASCDSHCGGSASGTGGTCFCDAACSSFGDCCADVAEECRPDSCWEQCGGVAPGGTCFCDDLCTGFGDCCSDFADSCE